VRAEQVAADEVRLELGATVLWLKHLVAGEVALTKGWYCPEFGRRLENVVVRWTATVELPGMSGWCLAWDRGQGRAELSTSAGGGPMLRWTPPNPCPQSTLLVDCLAAAPQSGGPSAKESAC